MSDFMEMGSIIALEGGWFLDKETNTKFRRDAEGNIVGEDGQVIMAADDEDYNHEQG